MTTLVTRIGRWGRVGAHESSFSEIGTGVSFFKSGSISILIDERGKGCNLRRSGCCWGDGSEAEVGEGEGEAGRPPSRKTVASLTVARGGDGGFSVRKHCGGGPAELWRRFCLCTMEERRAGMSGGGRG